MYKKHNKLITSLAVVLSALLASCGSNPSPAGPTAPKSLNSTPAESSHPNLGQVVPKTFPEIKPVDNTDPTFNTNAQAFNLDQGFSLSYYHPLIVDINKEYSLFVSSTTQQGDMDLSFANPDRVSQLRQFTNEQNLPILYSEGFLPVFLGKGVPVTSVNTKPLLETQSSVRKNFSLNLPKVFLNPGVNAFEGNGVTVYQVDGMADYTSHEYIYTHAPQKIDISNVVGKDPNYLKLASAENHGFRVGSIIIGNRDQASSGLVPNVNFYYAELSDPSYGVGDIIIDGYNQVLPSIINNSYTISYSTEPNSIYKNIERSLSLLTAQKYAPLLVYASGNSDIENLKVPNDNYAKYLGNLNEFGQSIYHSSALYHLLQNDQISKDMIVTTGVYYDPSKRLLNNMYQWYVNNLVPIDQQQKVREQVAEPVIDDSKLADNSPIDKSAFYSPLGAIKCGVVMYDCISASYIYYQSAYYNANAKPGYEHGNTGTSFAVPVVSAVAAMVKQQFPWMTASNLKTTLLTTATDIGDRGVDPIFGWGVINAANALRGPAQFAFGDFNANLSYRTYRPDNVKPYVGSRRQMTGLVGNNFKVNLHNDSNPNPNPNAVDTPNNPAPSTPNNTATNNSNPANTGANRSTDNEIDRSHALDKAKQGIYGALTHNDPTTNTSDHNSDLNSNKATANDTNPSDPTTDKSYAQASDLDYSINGTSNQDLDQRYDISIHNAHNQNRSSVDTTNQANATNSDVCSSDAKASNPSSAQASSSTANANPNSVNTANANTSNTNASNTNTAKVDTAHNANDVKEDSNLATNNKQITSALLKLGKNIDGVVNKVDSTDGINRDYLNKLDIIPAPTTAAQTVAQTDDIADSTPTDKRDPKLAPNLPASLSSNALSSSSLYSHSSLPSLASAPDFDAGHSNTVDLTKSYNSYFLNSISGSGGLIVNGSNSDYLYLAAVNTYTGNTVVNSGNLVLVAPSDIGVLYEPSANIPNQAIISSNVYVNHLGRFYMIDSAVGGNIYNNGLLLFKNVLVGGNLKQTPNGTLFVDMDSNTNFIQGKAEFAGKLKLIYSPLSESTNQQLHRVVLKVEKGYTGTFDFDANAYTTALVDYKINYTDKEVAIDTSLRSLMPALTSTETSGKASDAANLLKGAEHVASLLPKTQSADLFHSNSAANKPASAQGDTSTPNLPNTVDSSTQTGNPITSSSHNNDLLANDLGLSVEDHAITDKSEAASDSTASHNKVDKATQTSNGTVSKLDLAQQMATTEQPSVILKDKLAVSSTSEQSANADHSSNLNATSSNVQETPSLTLVGAAIETMTLDQLQKLFYRNAGTVYSDLRFVNATAHNNTIRSFMETTGTSFVRNDDKVYGYFNYKFGNTTWSDPQESNLSGKFRSLSYSGGLYTQLNDFNLAVGYSFNRYHWRENVDLISPTTKQLQTIDLGSSQTSAHTLALNLGYATTDSYYSNVLYGNYSTNKVTRSSIYTNDQMANFSTYDLGLLTAYGKQILDLGANGGVIFSSDVNWQLHYQGKFTESAQKSADQAYSVQAVDLHQRQSAQLSLDAKSKITWDAYSSVGLKVYKGYTLGSVYNYFYMQANLSQYLFTPTFSLDLNNSLAKISADSSFSNKTLLTVTAGYRLIIDNNFSFNVNANYQYSSNWNHYQVETGISYGF